VFARRAVGKRQRLIAGGSFLILLLAVLPNVLYLGHWPIPGIAGEPRQIHSEAEAQQHAAHCHLGPSTCTDQPSLVGTWWIGDDAWSLRFDKEPQRVESYDQLVTLEAPVFHLKPPPRYA